MLRLRIHLEGIMTKSDRALYLAVKDQFGCNAVYTQKEIEVFIKERIVYYTKQARRTK